MPLSQSKDMHSVHLSCSARMCFCQGSADDLQGGALVTFTVCAGGMLLLLYRGARRVVFGAPVVSSDEVSSNSIAVWVIRRGMWSPETADYLANYMIIAMDASDARENRSAEVVA
ncbi:Hypothetical predicted protein [Cloeon dipterum]|uniref:Uncharacterized protein n=1 Tax=Cloeon dipterum TaxID=197152 RepID=A0A8S1CKQ7_9INSE|nr:Hypothetical predicted protein [Cloeon dipterum]